MRVIISYIWMWIVISFLGFFLTPAVESWGESGIRTLQSNGLFMQYPSDLTPMSASSRKKIQGMLNQQLRGMGNTQVSVIAVDVLLHLPAFRVMIAKEQFVDAPTPRYLIKERKHFLAEAQKRGMIQSYGEIKETTIGTHSAIEFRDLDKGTQGFGDRVRIICGKDTWNISFTGSTRETYEQYRGHVTTIMNSLKVLEACQ